MIRTPDRATLSLYEKAFIVIRFRSWLPLTDASESSDSTSMMNTEVKI